MRPVVVVGSLHFDVVVDAPRLPMLDETLPGTAVRYACGGKGGNQAVAAARHGAGTFFAGCVGHDDAGTQLIANLRTAGVDTSGIATIAGASSGMSVAIVDARGDYGAVIVSGANQSIDPSRITVPDGALLVLQNEVAQAVNVSAAERARAAGATIVFNAAPFREMPRELLAELDWLVVNRVEAEMLAEAERILLGDSLELARGLAEKCRAVIVTLGAGGIVMCRNGGEPVAKNAPQVQAISAHGAGDVFVGAFSARLAAGDEPEEAVAYAQWAAALHVSTPVDRRHLLGPAEMRAALAAT
jgi:ribokinase